MKSKDMNEKIRLPQIDHFTGENSPRVGSWLDKVTWE